MRSGFAFSPKTFTHLASVDVKLAIDGFTEILRDPEFNNDAIYNPNDFLFQFRRNHASDSKLVPKVKEDDKLKVKSSRNSITFTFNKKAITPAFVLNYQKIDEDHLAPVIWYKNELYMKPDNFQDSGSTISVTYELTSSLGVTNNFLEYNANAKEGGAYMQSVVSQPVDGNTKEDNTGLSKDSAIGKEDDPIVRWGRLTDEEENLLLNEVFTSKEISNLKEIEDGKDRYSKAIDLVMKHYKSKRAVDKQFKNELKEIVDKLC